MHISIALPCYEMHGKGAEYLDHSLSIISRQTYSNIEVVLSDHSQNHDVEDVAKKWSGTIPMTYIRKTYDRDNPSSNLNVAMQHCEGDYIKILFLDDFLYNEKSIENLVKIIEQNPNCRWIASATEHSNDGVTFNRLFLPEWNDRMVEGINTISSPSAITVLNDKDKLFFDIDFINLMDCDFYVRMYNKFGLPVFQHDSVIAVNRTWESQLSNTLGDERKNNELELIKRKHAQYV